MFTRLFLCECVVLTVPTYVFSLNKLLVIKMLTSYDKK